MDITKRIEENFSKLSNKEKQIALYVIRNRSNVQNISITELAKLSDVSPATITRFCKKIGVESFSDFKFMLTKNQQLNERKDKKQKSNGSKDKLYSYYLDTIENSNRLIDEKLTDKLVDELISVNRVVVMGLGSSGLTAEEFQLRLFRMGINALAITDSHLIAMSGQLSQKDDIYIGISNSGETEEILSSLEKAKRRETTIYSLTGTINSSLHKLTADNTFITSNPTLFNNENFINTQLSINYLIDYISMKLLQNAHLRSNLEKTKSSYYIRRDSAIKNKAESRKEK